MTRFIAKILLLNSNDCRENC